PCPDLVPSGGSATLPFARPLPAATWPRRTNTGGTAPPRRLFPVIPSPPRLDGAVPWPLLTRRRRARRTSPLPRHRQRPPATAIDSHRPAPRGASSREGGRPCRIRTSTCVPPAGPTTPAPTSRPTSAAS